MSEVTQDPVVDQPAEAEPMVTITDLHQFVALVTNWHASKIARLEHMLSIPEGTEVSVNDGEMTAMSGDLRQGFVIGLITTLSEIGSLPFVITSDEDSIH